MIDVMFGLAFLIEIVCIIYNYKFYRDNKISKEKFTFFSIVIIILFVSCILSMIYYHQMISKI